MLLTDLYNEISFLPMPSYKVTLEEDNFVNTLTLNRILHLYFKSLFGA